MKVFFRVLLCSALLVFVLCITITSKYRLYPKSLIESDGHFPQQTCHKHLDSSEEWTAPKLPKAISNVSQDDPELVKQICEQWILPPFTGGRRLAHSEKEHYSQSGQSEFIDGLLKHKTNGFFIECGAANGEQYSNSLFFEKSRNWTGLLVEANPKSFRSLLKTRRHAYMVNTCLSPTTRPVIMNFTVADVIGGLPDYMERSHQKRIEQNAVNATETIEMQCLPLYSILQAIGVTYIDYFSLDVEGAELEVLYTLPLDEITIDVVSIEYFIINNAKGTEEKLEAIKQYLVNFHGYRMELGRFGADVILKKNEYYQHQSQGESLIHEYLPTI